MADKETVTIKDVEDKNSAGWYRVVLEGDSRTPSTKSDDVAQAAFAARGKEVEVVIGSTVNGNFTNFYLNEIDGVKDKPVRRSGGSKAASNGSGGYKPDPEKDKRIGRQWALGRAVELMVASGTAVFPLTDEAVKALVSSADMLEAARDA